MPVKTSTARTKRSNGTKRVTLAQYLRHARSSARGPQPKYRLDYKIWREFSKGKSVRSIAQSLDIHHSTAQHRLKRALEVIHSL